VLYILSTPTKVKSEIVELIEKELENKRRGMILYFALQCTFNLIKKTDIFDRMKKMPVEKGNKLYNSAMHYAINLILKELGERPISSHEEKLLIETSEELTNQYPFNLK
jgi:hypothetical protein